MFSITMSEHYATAGDPFTEVRLLCVDGPGDQPVIGICDGAIETWTAIGAYYHGQMPNRLDLVPLQTKPVAPLRCWGNAGGGLSPDFYASERAAQAMASTKRTRIAVPMIEKAAAQGMVEALQAIAKNWPSGPTSPTNSYVGPGQIASHALAAWEAAQ